MKSKQPQTEKGLMRTKTLLTAAVVISVGLLAQPICAQEPSNLLKPYEAVSTAQANDDIAAAKKAAGTLAEQARAAGNATLAQHAGELAKSDSLEAAREHFKGMGS
jgi:hypothetical protein